MIGSMLCWITCERRRQEEQVGEEAEEGVTQRSEGRGSRGGDEGEGRRNRLEKMQRVARDRRRDEVGRKEKKEVRKLGLRPKSVVEGRRFALSRRASETSTPERRGT